LTQFRVPGGSLFAVEECKNAVYRDLTSPDPALMLFSLQAIHVGPTSHDDAALWSKRRGENHPGGLWFATNDDDGDTLQALERAVEVVV
jgi:hypothetical protein